MIEDTMNRNLSIYQFASYMYVYMEALRNIPALSSNLYKGIPSRPVISLLIVYYRAFQLYNGYTMVVCISLVEFPFVRPYLTSTYLQPAPAS